MNVLVVGILGNMEFIDSIGFMIMMGFIGMIILWLHTQMSRKKLGKPKSAFKVRVENDGIYVSALKQDNAQLTQLNYDLMKKYRVKTSDPVTNDVIDRIFIRHQQGMKKFKVTMAQNSKSIPEWIEDTI